LIDARHPLVRVVAVWVWRWVTVPAVTLRSRPRRAGVSRVASRPGRRDRDAAV